MKPGELLKIDQIQIDQHQYYLIADLKYWRWIEFEEPCFLLCVNNMAMTTAWINRALRSKSLSLTDFVVGSVTTFTTDLIFLKRLYNAARKEYEETKKIKGYKFLLSDGKTYIWLGHYEVEFLEFQKYYA